MGDYERTASERRGSKRLYTAKENAAIRSSKVMSTLSDDAAASRTKERIEAYGNSALYRNIGSDDRINGKVYNNTGNNDSEIKSYAAGYYINGEKRVLAKLDKLTKEESIASGEYEYSILGIPVDNLNLLKKNDDYMTGYMSAMLMNNNSKKHR